MMLKDIHEPLMEGGDTAGNHNAQNPSFSQLEQLPTPRDNPKKVGTNDFYNNQLDTFETVSIDKWKDIQDSAADDELSKIMEIVKEQSALIKDTYKKYNEENRKDVEKIKILPYIKTDKAMMAEEQKKFIKENNVKKSADPEEVIQMLRLKQLEDAFKDGYKHIIHYDTSMKAQHSDLIVTSEQQEEGGKKEDKKNSIILVQTGIDKQNKPLLYLRQVEKEGNIKKEGQKSQQQLLASVGGQHDICDDQANRILIHLQENEDEEEYDNEDSEYEITKDEGNKKKLWSAVPDPQAKLWIQIGDFIYFYVVKNNFKNKTTQFTLKKLNITDFNETDKGPVEVENHKSEVLTLEPKEYKQNGEGKALDLYGIQFVAWAVNMGAITQTFKVDLAANMTNKESIDDFCKGQLLILQGQCKTQSTKVLEQNAIGNPTQDVHCGMVVTPQNIGEIMFSWKQQNALEKSTAAVKKDKFGKEILDASHTKIKYKEETSLSFMLAVWKTQDLLKNSPSEKSQRFQNHWGAGIIYKMSRGDSKISKQVFWINQAKPKSDIYSIDKDIENIYDEENKGMRFFKQYKTMADMHFQCYYHQIFTFDKPLQGKFSFIMEKLSPDDPHFKIDLFQKKIHGLDENGDRHSNSLLSKHADVSNLCKRDQMMMVIKRDYRSTHDMIRAVVIEKNLNKDQIDMIKQYDENIKGQDYSPNHRIKTIMAVHKTSSVVMKDFKFEEANLWTQVQKVWSKGYKQIDPLFCNIFVDDVEQKVRFIEQNSFQKQKKTGKFVKFSLNETAFASIKSIKPEEKDGNLNACLHSTYNTLRKVKSSDNCPYEAFKKIDLGGDGDVISRYHAFGANNGKISARQMETYSDNRNVYLRQIWGYDKTNKEIFIQVMKTKGDDYDHNDLDEVMSETHCYTYFHPDPVVGSSNDGFMTPRMKNTAFCPSSAIEKLEGNDKFEFQQKHDLVVMDESGLFMDIFVYLLQWNDSEPTKDNQLLQLIGRKMLVLSYNYQPDLGPRLMNYYPLIPGLNYKIEGTHLFTNHSDSIIPWNIEIRPFTPEEYQFKGELCNTGYKIYEFQNRQCAILIDTQLSHNLIKLNARNIMENRVAKREYELEQKEKIIPWRWGKEKNFEPSLNNIQKNLIFEDQIRVTLNLWTPLPLAKIIKNSEKKEEIDFLAPLVVVNGLSFANFIINEPNAITTMMASTKISTNRSIIQQFSVYMKKIKKKNGKFTDCFEELQSALPEEKGWIRKDKEIMEDYLFQNPLFKCLDQEKTEDIKRTQVSCNILIDKVVNSGNSQVNYNRMIQILPMVVGETAKGIPFKEYAPFFQDFDDDNEDPLTFCIKVEDQGLPKFSNKEYFLQKFSVENFPDTDLRDNLIDHLKEEFAIVKEKQEKKKKLDDSKNKVAEIADDLKTSKLVEEEAQDEAQEGPALQKQNTGTQRRKSVAEFQQQKIDLQEAKKEAQKEQKDFKDISNEEKIDLKSFDIPVKHFMINLSYLQTSRVLQAYWEKPVKEEKNAEEQIECPNPKIRLDERFYLTEQKFTQTIHEVNMKYGDNVDAQETMKDILDYIFKIGGTRKYIIGQMIFYTLFFIFPFLTQMSINQSQFDTKGVTTAEDKLYYQNFSIGCMCCAMFANVTMFLIECLQIKQSGIIDYFQDDYYNIFDTSSFIIFTAYFVLRLSNPTKPMLVGSTDGLKDIPVDSILMITIAFNFFILVQIVVKCFFYLRVNPKFGLQVELVIQAIKDVKYFNIFMLIWITAFAIYTKILGSGNSQTAGNEWGGYPGTNNDFQIWMQTWEDSIGNIQNPTYNYWSSVIANHTSVVSESKDPNYLIDLYDHQLTGQDVFENINSRSTVFQNNTALFMIYTIYFFWILNQVFIFIILLNFLIAVISQSYEKVMDSKIQLQYHQRSILNNEFKIVMGSLGLLEKRCDCFLLTSNVEESDRGNEWSGFVQNMKKAIGKQASQINNNVKDLTVSISKYQENVAKQMAENQADNIRDIKKLKALATDLTVLICGEKPAVEEEKSEQVYESNVEK